MRKYLVKGFKYGILKIVEVYTIEEMIIERALEQLDEILYIIGEDE